MNAEWLQLETESAKAFAAFQKYCGFGAARSIRKLAQSCNKSASLVGHWSALHRWVERCRALDAHLAGQSAAAEEAKLTSAAGAWAARAQEAREDQWQVAEMLVAKARGMLAEPLDGHRWTFADAARLLECAARLHAACLGLPTGDATAVSVSVGLTVDQQEARLREVFGLEPGESRN